MQSFSLNPPRGPVNTRGVPYTDYSFGSSGILEIPWDAVAVQACAISGGGNGGAGAMRLSASYGGQSGGGGASGDIVHSPVVHDPAGSLIITVGAPGGGNSSIFGAGISITAIGGENGHPGLPNANNTAPTNRGGDGAAGGGGGSGSSATNPDAQPFYPRGRGGRGRGSIGSDGTWVANARGGHGGAFGGPNGGGPDVAAVSMRPKSDFCPFGDTSLPWSLEPAGGDGGLGGGKGAAYSGWTNTHLFGRGGNGGNGRGHNDPGPSIPGSPGVQGACFVRVYWEIPA